MTDETDITIPEPEETRPRGKKRPRVPWVWITAAALLIVLAGAGVFFWKGAKDGNNRGNSLAVPGQAVFPVPEKKELRFEGFLVPLPADPDHTGVSFAVVLKYRDSQWSAMTDPEKTWLRARIYDTLVKEMQTREDPPSADMMASWINRALRNLFPNRPVEAVTVDTVFIL